MKFQCNPLHLRHGYGGGGVEAAFLGYCGNRCGRLNEQTARVLVNGSDNSPEVGSCWHTGREQLQVGMGWLLIHAVTLSYVTLEACRSSALLTAIAKGMSLTSGRKKSGSLESVASLAKPSGVTSSG